MRWFKITTNLGFYLKYLREKNNLSRDNLAKLLGVIANAIGAYERGERIPRDQTKEKYAIIFNKRVDDIFYINK